MCEITEIPTWAKWFVFMALIGGPLICAAAMLVIRFYQTRIKTP